MVALVLVLFAAGADDAEELFRAAATAYRDGKPAEAIGLATKAAKADPNDALAPELIGLASLDLRRNAEAAEAFTTAAKLVPGRLRLYDRRGDAYLKLGKFKEAVADFDKFLELRPEAAPDHWRRGIALYYAGKFADGVKQFDLHRTVNPEDVENSAWHYLCNARATSPKQARADLLPVAKDARVPMKEVLQLFGGALKPADVLAAAEAADLKAERKTEARFYANLYVGLYYEAEGDAKKAEEHIRAAAEKYKIGHYMWDVANAHVLANGRREPAGDKP